MFSDGDSAKEKLEDKIQKKINQKKAWWESFIFLYLFWELNNILKSLNLEYLLKSFCVY